MAVAAFEVDFEVNFEVDFEVSLVVAFAADLKAGLSVAGEVGCVAMVASMSACFGSGCSFGACCLHFIAGLCDSAYLDLGLAVVASAGDAVIITIVAATIVKAWIEMTVALTEVACCLKAAACCSKAFGRYVEVRHSTLAAVGFESVVEHSGRVEPFAALPASITAPAG